MDFLSASIYGVIQGLSEFLPVSSSGHLALIPYIMDIKDPGVSFDLAMHGGTALAVILYFHQDLLRMIMALSTFKYDRSFLHIKSHPTIQFCVATLSSVVVILLLKKVAEGTRSPQVILFNQIFFGLLLWAADSFYRKRSVHLTPFGSERGFSTSIWIGLAQALAIFPGVSRSGITLTTALFFNVEKSESGRFSFLLSLPIILAGIIVEVPHLLKGEAAAEAISPSILLWGIFVSFVVGLLTIHYFLKVLRNIELKWFCFYRIFLGIGLAIFLYL